MPSEIIPFNRKSQQLVLFDASVSETPFDRIRHIDENGMEYWIARELMPLLDYVKWQNFKKVINRAKISAKTAGHRVSDHFGLLMSVTQSGKGRSQTAANYKLSRLACYLIIENGDPDKKPVADGQTYFAAQTRKQEIAAEKAKSQQQLKRNQDVTAYQLSGHDQQWSEMRVDSKDSHKALTSALKNTHENEKPDYGKISGAVNTELFDMTRDEIIEYLGLLSKDAKQYRDHLGTYALDALRQINYTSAAHMKRLGRNLTSDEQHDIVIHVVRIVAPTMRELAQYASVDFISGAELDESGKALIVRNIRLIGDGK
jgi:DNA-damage-inducible protein D